MQATPYGDEAALETAEGNFTKSKHLVAQQARDQRGQTCGLYALSVAGEAMTGKYVPATSGDLKQDRKHQKFSLRKAAKRSGRSKIGELFDAEYMVQLAPLLGLNARTEKVDDSSFFTTIVKAVDSHNLVIVPYSVDAAHPHLEFGPGTVGNNAHLVVAFGYQKPSKTVTSSSSTPKILITSWGKSTDGVAEIRWYLPQHLELRFPAVTMKWQRVSLNKDVKLPGGKYSYKIQEIVLT